MASPQAFESGMNLGYQRAQEPRLRKQALSDEEHAQKINDHIALRQASLEKLRNLKPGTPEYDQSFGDLQKSIQGIRELYHPDNHPNAIQKFGHLLTDALHVTNPQQRTEAEAQKKVAASTGDENTARSFASALPPSDIDAARSAAQAQSAGVQEQVTQAQKLWDQNNPQADEETKQKAHQEIFESAVLGYKRSASSERGSWEQVNGTRIRDGKPEPFAYYHDKNTNRNTALDGSDLAGDDLKDFTPSAKNAAKPSTSQFNETLAAYARSHNTTVDKLPFEAYQFVTRAMAMARGIPSASTNTGLKQDVNGMWVPVTETNTRTPGAGVKLNDPLGPANSNWMAPTAAPGQTAQPDARSGTSNPQAVSSTAPLSPAELRKEAEKRRPTSPAGITSGHTHVGPPLFQGRTPEITKAHNDLIAATKIENMGEDMVANPSSEKDALFVLSLIRSEAGRVNQQEIAQLFNAGGISEGPERWAAKFGHGELSPDLRQQLLDFTKAQAGAAQTAYSSLLDPSAQGGVPSGSGGFDWNKAPEHK